MVKGAEAACKIIRNERINNFIIEGFLEGISKINKIPMKQNLMQVLGYYYDDESFYIFLPLKRSVFQFLHQS
jgi:hypothetical protein